MSRHLTSKTVLFCFRTKYIYNKAIASGDFSRVNAHIWHEKLLNKQFLYDFLFSFLGSISKVPTMLQKITIPTLRDISVSKLK